MKTEISIGESINYINTAVKPETEALQSARDKCQRCREHIQSLEEKANTLPNEIHELEQEVNDKIADGKSVTATEKKLNALRAELDRTEEWLNTQADSFTAKANDEQLNATRELQHAVDSAACEVLEDFQSQANAAMKLMFDTFEQWYQVKEGLKVTRLPEPRDRHLLNAARFVANEVYPDMGKQKRYKIMMDVLQADLMKAKYMKSDAQLKKSREAKPAATPSGSHTMKKEGTRVHTKQDDYEMKNLISKVMDEKIKPLIESEMLKRERKVTA